MHFDDDDDVNTIYKKSIYEGASEVMPLSVFGDIDTVK